MCKKKLPHKKPKKAKHRPRTSAPPCKSKVYWLIAPGDTFYKIAKATGNSVTVLLILNPHLDPLNLPIGQRICLP